MEKLIAALLNQAPDVTDQLVLMSRIDSVGWFIVCILGVVGGQVLVSNGKKMGPCCFRDLGIIGGWFLTAVFGFGLISNPVDFIETIYAPKAVAIREMLHHIHK